MLNKRLLWFLYFGMAINRVINEEKFGQQRYVSMRKGVMMMDISGENMGKSKFLELSIQG